MSWDGTDQSDHGIHPTAISDLAQSILSTVNSTYVEYATLYPQLSSTLTLPLRQYIYFGPHGSVVHDDEQLTVQLVQTYSGVPGPMQQVPVDRNKPRTAWFVVELVRKVPNFQPNGKPPTTTDIQNKAVQQMTDAQLLMEAGLRACEAHWWEKGIVDVTAGSAQGGLQSSVLTVITAI